MQTKQACQALIIVHSNRQGMHMMILTGGDILHAQKNSNPQSREPSLFQPCRQIRVRPEMENHCVKKRLRDLYCNSQSRESDRLVN